MAEPHLDIIAISDEAQLAIIGRQYDVAKDGALSVDADGNQRTAEQIAAAKAMLHDAFSIMWLIKRDKDLRAIVERKLTEHKRAARAAIKGRVANG